LKQRGALYSLPRAELARVVDSLEKQGDGVVDRLFLNGDVWAATLLKLRGAGEASQTRRLTGVLDTLYILDNPIDFATRQIRSGRFAAAAKRLGSLDHDDPDSYYAHNLMAHCHIAENQLELAEQALSRAFELSVRRPEAYLNRARLCFKQNRLPDALRSARQASELVRSEERAEYETAELLAFIQARRGNGYAALRELVTIAKLQATDSPLQGVVYPARGLRESVSAELFEQPEGLQARLLQRIVLVLLRVSTLGVRLAQGLRNVKSTSGGRVRNLDGLTAGSVHQQGDHWWFRLGEGSAARPLPGTERSRAVRIEIETLATTAAYDVQLNRGGVRVQAGREYALTFTARADAARLVAVGCARSCSPWSSLGLYTCVNVETDWRSVELSFLAEDTDDRARIHFDVGGSAVSVEFADLSLVETNTVRPALERA
jgi:tetratricopeptide (TPR) repeat protein